MNDEPPSLSLEEKNNLYMKAVIPFGIILVAFMIYVVYRMNTSPPKLLLGLLLEFFTPFVITEIFAMMLTVEVFYHLKVKKPFRFHAKRIGMNALLALLSVSTFLVVAVSVDALLSTYVGQKTSILVASVSWTLVFAAVILKFQNTIRKYWKEP